MNYNIKAKKTLYNGIVFRSRLEAKWATFFDLIGWEWAYEPSAINGYNPDFIIRAKSEAFPTKQIICEIKPALLLNKDEIDIIFNKYKSLPAHILILDDMPFEKTNGLIKIGTGSQFWGEHGRSEMEDLVLKTKDDFSSELNIWDGMVFGNVERKHFLDYRYVNEVLSKWIWAGNETMFNY